MRVKSLKVFTGVLMFGLLLGASSTAYADGIAVTSLSFTNLQFTASSGTAQFTVTGVTARAEASIPPVTQNNISNSFPIAQASAVVNGTTAAATANAATHSLSADTTAIIGGCSCATGSFGQATLTGTLVLSGVEGNVNVNISALQTLLRQVSTDAFGMYAESGTFFDLFVNGSPVFSLQIEALNPTGPNGSALVQAVSQISRTITLQGGTQNTIFVRLSSTSLAINEVPEPASIVMLLSGFGFMTGVLKRRRDRRR
ncbi:MAG TPA: PEP-CTERM sorting domain-containing protein [Pyrinomonadaceae bacterium]|nr:PEP-CTERM sorting domain-containing protein [Pyrinomonadaceae bacterium]